MWFLVFSPYLNNTIQKLINNDTMKKNSNNKLHNWNTLNKNTNLKPFPSSKKKYFDLTSFRFSLVLSPLKTILSHSTTWFSVWQEKNTLNKWQLKCFNHSKFSSNKCFIIRPIFAKPTESLERIKEAVKTYIAFGWILSCQIKKELLHVPVKYWLQM